MLTERKDRSSGVPDLVLHTDGGPIPADSHSEEFKAAVRRAKLPDALHFHSLRHTFATWHVQNGASPYEVQKLLGHCTITATQIYAHLATSELRGAINRIIIDMTTVKSGDAES